MEKSRNNVKSATIWHLKNLVKGMTTVKFLNTAQPEIDKVLDQSPDGEEYRLQLVKILLKEIDFKPSATKQKEAGKINLLKPNLEKIMQSPYFLTHHVFEIFKDIPKIADHSDEILKPLKFKSSQGLIFCLGIYAFCKNSKESKSIKVLKQKLKEWFEYEKDGELPSFAVYEILNSIKEEPELRDDPTFSKNIREFLTQQNVTALREESMQVQKVSSIFECNRTSSLYKYEGDVKNNSDFKFVEKLSNTHQVLEPWQVLIELGPSVSEYETELLYEVLKDFNKTSLRGLAHTLVALSNHFTLQDREKSLETITMKCNMKGDMTYMNENPNDYEESTQQWNLEQLSKVFKEVYPSATWIELIKFLDVDIDAREEFYFQSQEAFDVFMKLWTSLKPPSKPFPLEFLIANAWKNKRAYITCIEYAINYSFKYDGEDESSFDSSNKSIPFERAKRRTELNKQLQGIKPNAGNYIRIWNCIDLVQNLVNFSDSNHYNRVKKIFEPAVKAIPEYLLLTLIKIKAKNGRFMLEELYSQILPMFLIGHPNSVPILNEVWNADKNIIINAVSSLYGRNQKNMNLSRVLDICQSVKNSLLVILETCKDYNFTIQLALLAAKRDFLHFERSIEKMIQSEGEPLYQALFKYINTNLLIPIEKSRQDNRRTEEIIERSLLSEERLQIIVEKLIQFKELNPKRINYMTQKKFEDIYSRLVKFFPNIQSEESTSNEVIEEKGNEYFQKLYKGEKSVEDLVDTMRKFRSSTDSTEREIYACMVQNLFDEWKFFPKYPKKELEMTAKLFGKIMSERKIIDGVVTDIGLKCIIEGLKYEGKMFLFSVTALEE